MQSGNHYLILCGTLSVGLLASCGGPNPASPDAVAAPRPVQVVRAAMRPMERTIAVTGTLAAQEASTLSAKVPGRLARLAVDLGSVVRRGDVLAQIEPRDYELRLQQATAALSQARAGLGLPLEGDNDQVELEAVSSVKQARALLDESLKNRERVQNLSESGIASASELDTVDFNYAVVKTRFDAALDDARTRLASLAQRRAELELAKKQLADATVVAPYDGAIQSRPGNVGEYVSAGTPIVTMVKTDPLRLRLEIPERESALVCQDQPVRLTAEGMTSTFIGRISRLSPALNPYTRMLLVEADVPNPGSLRAGLFARAEIVINPRESGLTVPAQALVTFAGIEKVLTINDGRAVEQTVTTGRRGSDWVEITSGITAGTPVVVDPRGLRGGQPVTVSEPSNNPQTTQAEAASE